MNTQEFEELCLEIVKNLKPIKLRVEDSCGMLLCAANDEDSSLELLNVAKMNPGDSVQ